MKILILLSLAGICLAKHQKGRPAFSFPGQPSNENRSHTFVWDEFGEIGQLNPERARRQSHNEVELRNPNRRDVKIGNFPARGFRGAEEKENQAKDVREVPQILLSVKSKSPLIRQEEPLFAENTTPVLEKEKSSSSESAEANNQEKSSSSEENASAVANQDEPSASEISAPVNEEEPVNAESIAQSNNEAEAPVDGDKAENPSNDSNGSAQNTSENEEEAQSKVVDKKEDFAAQLGLQPFVAANSPRFGGNALRKLVFSLRDADGLRPESPSKANSRGSRPIRGVEFNFSDVKLSNSRNNVQEPQGQIKAANGLRRWRRPIKK